MEKLPFPLFSTPTGAIDAPTRPMQAVQLFGADGPASLRIVALPRPQPGPGEVLIQVKAAGVNFADTEMLHGRYPAPRPLPCTIGFEAAGVVAAIGAGVTQVRPGDRMAAIVSTGGYAEYALADARGLIPIPEGISFAAAATIPVQGISALALLRHAAKPQPTDRILIQAAAGGVGLYLVQLARLLGVRQIIALASSRAKLDLVTRLGADVAIDYSEAGWADRVRAATDGQGVDLVLECVSGTVGEESFRLLAPFGRVVVFGAKNVADTLTPEKMRQLIHRNQTLTGFNIPTLRPEQIGACVPELLRYISSGQVKLFADHVFPLAEVHAAHAALLGRGTVGKVVLTP